MSINHLGLVGSKASRFELMPCRHCIGTTLP